MMEKKEIYFRCLRAEDVNARVQKLVAGKGAILLLYKDARCDMAMLDEAVGAFNWKREHSRDNANCTISIWDEDKSQWVSKEDVGTPSNTEAEKGLASDAFKRAGFNWGIGRELYTAPFIWVNADKFKTRKNQRGGEEVDGKFLVTCMDVDEDSRKITRLEIAFKHNNNPATPCFKWVDTDAKPATTKEPAPPQTAIPKVQLAKQPSRADQLAELERLLTETNTDRQKFFGYYKVENADTMDADQLAEGLQILRRRTAK